MGMKLSVIIPVYNVEDYLRECLESVIFSLDKCNGLEWEAILVDDGSEDGSGDICDEYSLKNTCIRVIHQKNQGVSAARNAGLEVAQGEWVSFVDSDDKIIPGYGCDIINGSDYDIIFFAFDKQPVWNSRYFSREDTEKEIYRLKHNSTGYEFFGYTCNKYFRNSIIKKYNIKFPVRQRHREDEFFTTEYCRYINSIFVVNRACYWYRDEGEISHLTGRYIGAEELMELAGNVVRQMDVWHDANLRDYETFRAARMMYDALRKTSNPIKQYGIACSIGRLDFHASTDSSLSLPSGVICYKNHPLIMVLWINARKLRDKLSGVLHRLA